MIPSIIVHGGAKTISDGKVAANNAGLRPYHSWCYAIP